MSRVLLCLSLFVFLPGAVAQPPGVRLRGETDNTRTRKRLTEAQQKLADGDTTIADELQDILDQSGDELVLVNDNSFQPARRLVQQFLSTLPPKPLATFRDRIEEPAKKLLDDGRRTRDPKPLRELVERYFVSRPAEEGLVLLGELEFERGDFVSAERHWRALLPDDGQGGLRYPQPTTDPALVRAKLILTKAIRGDRAGATRDLEQFALDHPKASGRLAGTTGVLAETLAKLVPTVTPPPGADPAGWTTFAAGPSRNGRPDAPLPRYWPSRPTWTAAIPREPGDDDRPPPASIPASKTLAFHPVILNGVAYVANAGRVYQFDLKTGANRIAFHSEVLDAPPNFDADDLKLPNTEAVDFTLTAAGGRLFARLGPVALPAGDEDPKSLRTYLVALRPKPNAGELPRGELPLKADWQLAPPAGEGVVAAWEGAPLVADKRVYASFVKVENNKLVYAIACYPEAGGQPLWVTQVCEADPRGGGKKRHELLTLAGPNVVYGTHAGVTVAVNAESGKPAWAFRNPPADRPPLVSPRDLCPPVYSDGRVFIAPADGEGVFALDSDTGRRVWSTANPIQVENLLGVSGGRLIVTTHSLWNAGTSRPELNTGVRAYDVETGLDRPPVGWQQHDDPRLGNYGRGLAGENLVLWPTAAALWPLAADTGRPARPPVPRPHGNLAFAEGVVVVASATQVWGYVFDGDSPTLPPPRGFPVLGAKDPPAFDPTDAVPAADDRFDPLTALSLPAPAVERKAVSLPALARPLTPVDPPRHAPLVLCDGRRLFAHDPDSGERQWATPLDPPAVLDRVAFTDDSRVIGFGDDTVVAVDTATGKTAWRFDVPPADPTPKLSAFAFTGNRLVARLGPRAVLALDLSTGVPAWVRNANGEAAAFAYTLDSAKAFGPHLAALGDRVFVQQEGECWVLDAGTGEGRSWYATPLPDWTCPPIQVGGKPVLPTADGGLMRLTGEQPAFVLTPGRPASWTGAPPTFRAFGDAVFAVVPRNFGDDFHRLSSETTRPSPCLLPSGVDLLAGDTDDERLYLPAAGKLIAVTRDSLREVWQLPLPEVPDEARWRVRAGRTTAIVHPDRAFRVEPWDAAREFGRLVTRPSALRLLGTACDLFHAATQYTFPVLILDSGTGKLLQRFDLPVGGPDVCVRPRADGLLVAGTGRAVWLTKK